jgi:formylglycine-generating enzyme required for sulfatase activity
MKTVLNLLLILALSATICHAADYADPTTGMEFVFVKGGCYKMGDAFTDIISAQKPVHEVCVDDFYIGKYEVTQAEYQI